MNLKPSLNDGHHCSVSFDVLLAMFLTNFYLQFKNIKIVTFFSDAS